MRIVAAIFTLLSLAATGWAGQALWQEIAERDAAHSVAASLPKDTAPGPVALPPAPRSWPALFGEPRQAAPLFRPPEPKEDTAPTTQAVPPLDTLGFSLSGIVRSGDQLWALVGHHSGQLLLRVGEQLASDIQVVDIDEDGVWLSRSGNAPELLGFAD